MKDNIDVEQKHNLRQESKTEMIDEKQIRI